MNPETDLEWLADLAYLRPGAAGDLLLVYDGKEPPVALPHRGGLSVHAAHLDALPNNRPFRGIYAAFVQAPSDPAGFAAHCSQCAEGPVVIRINAAGPDTRETWDGHFLDNRFRRHPLLLTAVPFEQLECESGACLLAYLPVNATEAAAYPPAALAIERNLHMDMLREAGRRADAHLARYSWAAGFLRPNDVVVDAACGLGYGSAILMLGSRAGEYQGFDNSEFAVRYARTVYGADPDRWTFTPLDLEQPLPFRDSSVDCVVSFETLEHLANPERLVAEALRILKPGGRFLCSVPNRWIDETGRDPSPYHLQVFELGKLVDLCRDFRIDQVVSQCAGGGDPRFSPHRRFQIHEVIPSPGVAAGSGTEWWLLAAMKDPLAGTRVPYSETVFPALRSPTARQLQYGASYANPWLVHALVHNPFRLRSPVALARAAREVVDTAPIGSADRSATLAVLSYQILAQTNPDRRAIEQLLGELSAEIAVAPRTAHDTRWRISLLFAAARLQIVAGQRAQARESFLACAAYDFRSFSVHIATKTTEAAFLAGKLAFVDGDTEAAATAWRRGLAIGRDLGTIPLDEVLIASENPHLFGLGDGMREFTLAWDNVTRCANGIHVLAEQRELGRVRLSDLEQAWQRAENHNRHFVGTMDRQAEHIAVLEAERDRLTAEAAAARDDSANAWAEAQRHIDALRTQLDRTVQDYENIVNRLQPQVADTVQRYEPVVAGLRNQLEQLAATSREQADHIAVLEKERDRLAALVTQYSGDIAQLSSTAKSKTDYIVVLERERDRLAARETQLTGETAHYLKVMDEQLRYIRILEAERSQTSSTKS